MQLAVGLFGIHHINELNHWMGWKNGVDYRETYHNQFSMLYSKFQTKYYSATYYSDIKNELMDDYNFVSVTFANIDNTESNPIVKRNRIFKNTIKLILDDKTNWDLAILTRYDLRFKDGFYSLNIDFNKVNFLCGAKWGDDVDLVDDNIYAIPKPILKDFYEKIDKIPENVSSHQYHKWFDEHNFMIQGSWYSHENPFYEIVRIPLHSQNLI